MVVLGLEVSDLAYRVLRACRAHLEGLMVPLGLVVLPVLLILGVPLVPAHLEVLVVLPAPVVPLVPPGLLVRVDMATAFGSVAGVAGVVAEGSG